MKISTLKLMDHVGEIVVIKDAPGMEDGTYQIMSSEFDTDRFYHIKNGVVVDVKMPVDFMMNQIYTPIEEKLEMLYESYIKLCMRLLGAGYEYSEDEDFKGKNLYPYVTRLRSLKVLMLITHEGDEILEGVNYE